MTKSMQSNRTALEGLSETHLQGALRRQPGARDPANLLYSRMPLVRLDAESLYDATLLVAGQLNPTLILATGIVLAPVVHRLLHRFHFELNKGE